MRLSGDVPTGSFVLGSSQGSSTLGMSPGLKGRPSTGTAGRATAKEGREGPAPEVLSHWWLY